MNEPSLERILEACLKGKQAAQKDLYMMHKDRLFALALRYAEDQEEAQDIFQDGFVKIFKDLKDYRPIAPLFAWLKTVMVRTALENIRRKKSRIGRGLEQKESIMPGISEQATEILNAQELMKLIRALPEELRTVFNLHAIEGYSHKEIAQLLKISEGNSKVRLSRARSILRKEVEVLFD